MGVVATGAEAVGVAAAEDNAGAGAVPDGELAGEVADDCGCDEEAGSLDRCCHLILLLNRFFISATRNPLLGQGLRVSPPQVFIWLAAGRVERR